MKNSLLYSPYQLMQDFFHQQYFIHGAFGKHVQQIWLHLLRSTTTDTDTMPTRGPSKFAPPSYHPRLRRHVAETDEQCEKIQLFRLYIGDNKLPSHVGIIINHYKDPYWPTSISWKVSGQVFFRGSDEIYRLKFWDVSELILSILY